MSFSVFLTDETVGPPAIAGGGSGQRQAGWPSRPVADRTVSRKGGGAQRPRRGRRDFGSRRREQRRADVIMVARVVMIRPGNVMGMAMLGVKTTVIGLGCHRARPVLDRLEGRGNRQR
jgi:hypothetical protein